MARLTDRTRARHTVQNVPAGTYTVHVALQPLRDRLALDHDGVEIRGGESTTVTADVSSLAWVELRPHRADGSPVLGDLAIFACRYVARRDRAHGLAGRHATFRGPPYRFATLPRGPFEIAERGSGVEQPYLTVDPTPTTPALAPILVPATPF